VLQKVSVFSSSEKYKEKDAAAPEHDKRMRIFTLKQDEKKYRAALKQQKKRDKATPKQHKKRKEMNMRRIIRKLNYSLTG
jgi:hypothetical protein